MADGQYVEDTGNGYNVVDNGNVIGTYDDINAAQDAYNQATGGGAFQSYDSGSGGGSPDYGGGGGSGGGGQGWNDPSGIPGLTVGQLFSQTYNQPGQDPYSIWQQQGGGGESGGGAPSTATGSSLSSYYPLLSPPGVQAPIDQHNYTVDANGLQKHAPGTPAPVDQYNLTNMPNTTSPQAFAALSMLPQLGAQGTSGWDNLDQATKDAFNTAATGAGMSGQQLWERENASNKGGGSGGAAPSPVNTWNTLDGTTKSLFDAQAQANGNGQTGQQLWEQENARNMAAAGAPPATTPKPAVGTPIIPPGSNQPAPGGKSLDQMTQELRQAGYNGPWDQASILAAYKRTVNGGNAPAPASNNSVNAQLQAQMQAIVDSNKAAQQIQQQQFQQTSQVSQLNNLLSQAKNYPGAMTAVNALMSSLGLPPITTGEQLGATGIMPNQINPAMWDAMPAAAKALVLAAWEARGGDPADFTAGIDAQRPSGRAPGGVQTVYARA